MYKLQNWSMRKRSVSAQRQMFVLEFTKVFFLWVYVCGGLGVYLFGFVGFVGLGLGWFGFGWCWTGGFARRAWNAPETENPFQTVYLDGRAYWHIFFRNMHVVLLSHTVPISSCCFFWLHEDDLARLKISWQSLGLENPKQQTASRGTICGSS